MNYFFKAMVEDTSDCHFDENIIQRCPFLRNINKPTSFSFSPVNCPNPARGTKGPIFEDGPNFDMAFKVFHGKDAVVPLSNKSYCHPEFSEPEPFLQFNPLAAKAATISLSGFGPGWPFGFGSFHDKWKKQNRKHESINKKESSSQKGEISKQEALGNDWLETGNCPMAKSYRAMGRVLPLVASTLWLPLGMKLKCPPAVVAARAALARSALVKSLRPQPLPAKMFVIALLGMAANVPLGVWREHTKKFSLAWFTAVHAAVPFIAMLRKSVVMPKTAMALTIGASILGQVIGSRAERHRLKALDEKDKVSAQTAIAAAVTTYGLVGVACGSGGVGSVSGGHCGTDEVMRDPLLVKNCGLPPSTSDVCC